MNCPGFGEVVVFLFSPNPVAADEGGRGKEEGPGKGKGEGGSWDTGGRPCVVHLEQGGQRGHKNIVSAPRPAY